MIKKRTFINLFLVVLTHIQAGFLFVKAGETEFLQLVQKVEGDVIQLARQVESLYKNRCTNFDQCYKNNYHECVTSFPNQTCPGGEQLGDKKCGDDITCSRLWDYSVSRVSLPEDVANGQHQNPTDPEVIETVCFSRHLDEWFQNKHYQEKQYWEEYGLETPPVYFGAHNGLFRIYPAYRSQTCGDFDPRKRPWYIAASSGPKNIMLVLDVSGSMLDNSKFDLMKEAAKRIVSTLDIGDRIAIVPFSTSPINVIAANGRDMYVVTEENKELLLGKIDQLYAGGATNFYEAFVKAFNIFDATFVREFHVDCNSAILFFTDGAMSPRSDNMSEQDVIDFIADGIAGVEEKIGHPVFLFTYSISGEEANRIPHQLSCAVKSGVWSKLDHSSQIIDSLTGYYQLFALGLGDNMNENFTAWVEPYVYADGVSTGTTVSAPVYDRDKDPHLFLGVVGLDFRLAAVDIALGTNKDDSIALDRIVSQSTAKCPSLDTLSHCELESYRRQGIAGNDALCTGECTESHFVAIEPEKCKTVSDYPNDLWANFDEEGMPYEARACCIVGETSADELCGNPDWTSKPDYPNTHTPSYNESSDSSSSAGIGGAVVVIFIVLIVVACCFMKQRRRPIGMPMARPPQIAPPIPAPPKVTAYPPAQPQPQPAYHEGGHQIPMYQQGQSHIPMATVVQSVPTAVPQYQNVIEVPTTQPQPGVDPEIICSAPPAEGDSDIKCSAPPGDL